VKSRSSFVRTDPADRTIRLRRGRRRTALYRFSTPSRQRSPSAAASRRLKSTGKDRVSRRGALSGEEPATVIAVSLGSKIVPLNSGPMLRRMAKARLVNRVSATIRRRPDQMVPLGMYCWRKRPCPVVRKASSMAFLKRRPVMTSIGLGAASSVTKATPDRFFLSCSSASGSRTAVLPASACQSSTRAPFLDLGRSRCRQAGRAVRMA